MLRLWDVLRDYALATIAELVDLIHKGSRGGRSRNDVAGLDGNPHTLEVLQLLGARFWVPEARMMASNAHVFSIRRRVGGRGLRHAQRQRSPRYNAVQKSHSCSLHTLSGTCAESVRDTTRVSSKRDRLGTEARQILGARLRSLRGHRSIEEVARRARISSGSLSQLERGRSDPTLGTLLRLMHALDLRSVEELLGELPETPSARLRELTGGPDGD